MAHDLFVEEGDYFAFCHVDEKDDGTWMAWINFERKADHNAQLARIPGMRHALKDSFPSESAARTACVAYAQQVVAAGDVGL